MDKPTSVEWAQKVFESALMQGKSNHEFSVCARWSRTEPSRLAGTNRPSNLKVTQELQQSLVPSGSSGQRTNSIAASPSAFLSKIAFAQSTDAPQRLKSLAGECRF